MKKLLTVFFVCMSLSTIAFSTEEVSVIEGRLDLIEPGYIVMNNIEYKLANPPAANNLDATEYDFETTYWVSDVEIPYQINFNSLYGVGYADKVRITLQNNIVKKIEVLEMQQ